MFIEDFSSSIKSMKNVFNWLVMACAIVGCTTIDLHELNQENFGLISKAKSDRFTSELQYRPLYLVFYNKYGQLKKDLTQADVEHELGNYLNFNLKVDAIFPGQGEPNKSIDLQNSIFMNYGNMEVPCAFAQAEALGENSRYILSFLSPVEYGETLENDVQIIVDFNENTSLAFEIKKDKINKAEGLFEHFKNQLGK